MAEATSEEAKQKAPPGCGGLITWILAVLGLVITCLVAHHAVQPELSPVPGLLVPPPTPALCGYQLNRLSGSTAGLPRDLF
jgi:hypothetical protein